MQGSRELFLGNVAELEDRKPKIFSHGDSEIAVYRVNGTLYAYQNVCAHQGGPACEGLLMPGVEEVIAPDKTYQGMRFNYEEMHIVCPWHGWEYDLNTGEMVADRKYRLKRFEVVERDGRIYVLVDKA